MGMMTFWLVLSIAALALAVVSRIYPLIIASFGFACAAVMGWMTLSIVTQGAVALALLSTALYLWLRSPIEPDLHSQRAELMTTRRSGLGALSNFNAFSDEVDEVHVDHWDNPESTRVEFRGRTWTARLSKGSVAHIGIYKVREVRDGALILDELID